jgi:NAD(P)-dependent dehydrogenase (short-subunit alcohol dehydrogenase family)
MARILITGCRGGIGLDVACRLLKKGHSVYATVHREASVDELRSVLKSFGENFLVDKLDVTEASDINKVDAWDIDVLVNNAAVRADFVGNEGAGEAAERTGDGDAQKGKSPFPDDVPGKGHDDLARQRQAGTLKRHPDEYARIAELLYDGDEEVADHLNDVNAEGEHASPQVRQASYAR